MTQAQPAPTAQPMNRQQRRRAERAARKAGRRRTQTAGPVSPTLQQAALHHQAGQLEEAEALYRETLQKTPDDATALHFLGALLNQTGRSEEALPLLQKAAKQTPDDADIWNNLGVVCNALGRNNDAIGHYETAIWLRPDRFDPHKNLGLLYFREKVFDMAARHFEQAAKVDPRNPAILRLLGDSLQRQGDREGAIEALRGSLEFAPDDIDAIRGLAVLSPASCPSNACQRLAKAIIAKPNEQSYQIALERVMRVAPPQSYLPDFEDALVICIRSNFIPHQKLSALAAQQIILRYRSKETENTSQGSSLDQTRSNLNKMLGNELLICSLRGLVNTSAILELFLALLRRTLLFSFASTREIDRSNVRLLASLAQQCHNNSYVFYADDEEGSVVTRLAQEVGQQLEKSEMPNAELEAKLLLCSLYQPLHCLPNHKILSEFALEEWSPEVRPLIQTTLLDRVEEAALRNTISALTPIDDDISRAVRAQYEENPYPRWISYPRCPSNPLANQLRDLYPYFEPPAFLSKKIEVLVAGCGTGRHPITVAQHYHNSQVTAVDLSLASLAYAKRMARRLGVENISFYQGDILALGDLERQFPVIECAGVLHHMKDPDAGLASLVKILRPGGLLRLGLYSELGRHDVVNARERIAALGLVPTPENIRSFRQSVLNGIELKGSSLTTFADFFDLDSCRDLVFHVQEHRFTIPTLRQFLAKQNLEFLGFTLADDRILQAFRVQFPESSAMRDLDCWQAFEEANPWTFREMYQFWCQKSF